MKRLFAMLAVCGLGGVALALAVPTPPDASPRARDDAPAPNPPPADGKLVLHEWGTFTGFAGSDGVHRPFGTTVGGDLPAFVMSRQEQAERQGVKLSTGFLLRKAGGVFALQRMETPVIYFYSDRPRDVSVGVDFPQGLLTEFYPPVRRMAPAFGEGPGEYGAVAKGDEAVWDLDQVAPAPPAKAKLAGGALDWGKVRIVPRAAGEPSASLPEVPTTGGDADHYAYARETDADTVRFSDRPAERHEERFLFYRGVGDFTLPVTLTAGTGGRFELTNTGEHPVGFALLLRVAGGRAQFSAYRDVKGGRTMALPRDAVALAEVGEAIAAALVAEGLYEKEARAMVKTWSANWLGEPGTRVLYTVPRAGTDDLLPLRVSPAPTETVRVLVGRIDVMTPEDERRLQSLLATSRQAKALAPEDTTYLRGLGRFFRPALDRAAALRGSPDAELEEKALWSLYSKAAKATPTLVPATLP